MLQELKTFGLTEGRAYIALLKLGPSTAGPIVKQSGIAYSKVYEVLHRLIEKGLVSYTLKQRTRYFQAVDPLRLTDYLERKELHVQKEKELLVRLLPKLTALQNTSYREEAEVFIGVKGLRTAYDLLLKEDSTDKALRFFYVHKEEYIQASDLFYKQQFHEFKKRKIILKGITTKDYKNSSKYKVPPTFIQLRFVDFPVPSTIDIYGGAVLHICWGETPIGFLLHSKELATNMRQYFDTIWNVAKR